MKRMKLLICLAFTVMSFSVSAKPDPLIGNRYQITSVIGNRTETYTVVIDAAVAGGYYSGYMEGYDVRLTGPKTGAQICMTSEALKDIAFTFCFNGTVRKDKNAFTTVTSWDLDIFGENVILYSDVYRASVLRYKLTPTSVSETGASTTINNSVSREERANKAINALNSLKTIQ